MEKDGAFVEEQNLEPKTVQAVLIEWITRVIFLLRNQPSFCSNTISLAESFAPLQTFFSDLEHPKLSFVF